VLHDDLSRKGVEKLEEDFYADINISIVSFRQGCVPRLYGS
jgi:hypothetical protein